MLVANPIYTQGWINHMAVQAMSPGPTTKKGALGRSKTRENRPNKIQNEGSRGMKKKFGSQISKSAWVL